jgi:hypothetical protein
MGAAAGLMVWELSLSYDDPYVGVPGATALGLAGAGVIFGIIRPLLYHKSAPKKLVVNTSPWPSVDLIPVADHSGIKSVQFLCNWQF